MEVARPPAARPECTSNKFRKDISLAICLMVFLFAAQAAHAQRVDSGGSVNYTDSLGNLWAADNSFSGGAAFSTTAAISGTSDPTLYRTNRWATGAFSYSFPVPNGTYQVTLKFAEIYSGTMCTGCRLFNVSIEGVQVLSNFDVYAQVGANTALDKSFTVSVTDGNLDIAFTTVRGAAEVNAIAVVPAGPPDFSLSVEPLTQTMAPLDSITYLAGVLFLNGFDSTSTNLWVTGVPAGVTATYSPNPLPHQGFSNLTLTGDGTPTPGTYTLTMGATAGGITHPQNVTLVVSTVPDFRISVSPSTQNVAAGGRVTYQVSLTSLNGFSAGVTMSVSGLPTGASGSFSPNPVTAGAATTLTAATSTSTPQGQYPITITGTGGALSHSTQAALFVGPSGAAWAISPVGSTGASNNSLHVGPGRNDGVYRVYVGTVTTGRVQEFSWNGAQWGAPVDIGGSPAGTEIHNMGMGPGRNDNVTRIYAASLDGNLYELTYLGPGWTQATVGAHTNACYHAAVGNGRNDGVNRLYATRDSNVWEYTWNGAGWNAVLVGSVASSGIAHGVSIGDGRGDHLNHLYIASTSSGTYEATFSGGTWTMASMGDYDDVRNVNLGPGRNDGVPRVYSALAAGQMREFTWGGTSWSFTGINTPLAVILIHSEVYAGRNDAVMRVYSSGSDGNSYEFSWNGSSWATSVLGGGQDYMYGFHVGQGRNDGVNRLYAASFNQQVYEYTWTALTPPPTALPTVSITSPTSGQTVSGSVPVSASASSNVVRVQFLLDGANLGTAVTTLPYSVTWDTTTATNAAHTLSAIASDALGNQGTAPSVTVTVSNPPATPPVISNVAASGITSSSAMVTWTTDKPSDTQVDYGTTATYGNSTPLNSTLVTSHSATLNGLLANTLYHYRVKSSNSGGLSVSGDFTFNTSQLLISAVATSGISSTSATITWTTNFPSDTQVDYGSTASYGSQTALNSSPVTSHSASLTALTPSTTYHYRARSKDAAGNLALSGDFTLITTATPPYAVRVNSGGSNYTDTLGNVWAADNSFSGGAAFSTSAAITGTSDPTLYRTNRWSSSSFSYSFPVPNGTYSVTLKFAEIYGGTMCTGCRLFNVSIEGAQVLSNFDVYAQVGANTALDKTFTVSVTDGSLDIAFTTVRAAAEVNAIQVQAIP